jgi:hypothetical protein
MYETEIFVKQINNKKVDIDEPYKSHKTSISIKTFLLKIQLNNINEIEEFVVFSEQLINNYKNKSEKPELETLLFLQKEKQLVLFISFKNRVLNSRIKTFIKHFQSICFKFDTEFTLIFSNKKNLTKHILNFLQNQYTFKKKFDKEKIN